MSFRLTLWVVGAGLLVAGLTIPIGILGFAVLTKWFMTHDLRGMPHEPHWVGSVAVYVSLITLSAGVGYGIARVVRGVRATHMGTAGLWAGVLLWAAWVGPQVARGVAIERLAWASGLGILLGITVVTMSLFGNLGARHRTYWERVGLS